MDPVQTVYSCILVDDNKLDRLTTRSFIRNYTFLNITAEFEHAAKALDEMRKSPPEVMFLDIDMPDMNGLDLRIRLENIPACIFITAYPDYALPAFEVNALDFLVKPLRADRFDQTMNRLILFLSIRQKAALVSHVLDEDSIFIKDGRDQIKIHLQDILYLEALKDYTSVVTKGRKYCVLASLGHLLQEKSFQHFIRIHRSFAVQKKRVQRFNTKEVMVDDTILPVGRLYKDSLGVF